MAKGTKMADEMAGTMKAASASLRGDRGIFRQLKAEHEEITVLMNRCAATTDVELRRQLFVELRKQLTAHAKGEEREFYPVFRKFEETTDLVEEAIEDHAAIEELIDLLCARSVDTEEWADLFDELLFEIEDHMHQEEVELFPLCAKLIDDAEADKIGERYLHSRERLLRQVA